MDVGPLLILLLVAAAVAVLMVARGAPAEDGDAAAVTAAFLRPWLGDSIPESMPAEPDEPVRWRVELARPRRVAVAPDAPQRPRGYAKPPRGQVQPHVPRRMRPRSDLGDVAGLNG